MNAAHGIPPSEEVEMEQLRANVRRVAADVRMLLDKGYVAASLMLDDVVIFGCSCNGCRGAVRIAYHGDVFEPDWLNRPPA